MLGTIRRHQTWLWAIIITLTIASFVIFGPTNSRINPFSQGLAAFGKIGGEPITQDQFGSVQREILLEYVLRNEKPPEINSAEFQRNVYQRLFLIHQLKQFGIQVSTPAVVDRIRQAMGGSVSPDLLEEKLLQPAGLTLADLERFFRNELGIEQLVLTAGVTGKLVTPQEATTMYRLEHQDLQAQMAYFSASNYLSQVKITPLMVNQFYTNQMANYRLPEQMQISYVKFDVTNFLAAAKSSLTNLDQIVDQQVQSLGTNLFHNAKTPEESKVNVRAEIIREVALQKAFKAANQFAETLDKVTPRSVAGLENLAATNGLKVQTTALFEREYGPEGITVPELTKTAFQLTSDDPFGGPFRANDGVYVIALKTHSPSHTPELTEIEPKVTSDLRYLSAMNMAQQQAVRFDHSVTNGLGSGKSFAAICAQDGVKAETLPPFSLSTQTLPDGLEGKLDVRTLKQVGFNTPPGKSSPAVRGAEGAFVIYVEKRLPIDEAKLNTELPAFIAYLRQVRQNDAFNQWFNAQINQDPDFRQKLMDLAEQEQKNASARPSSS